MARYNNWHPGPALTGWALLRANVWWRTGEDYYTHMTDSGYDFRIDQGQNCGPSCSQVAWDERGNYSTLVFTSAAENIIDAHDATSPMFIYLAYQVRRTPVPALCVPLPACWSRHTLAA